MTAPRRTTTTTAKTTTTLTNSETYTDVAICTTTRTTARQTIKYGSGSGRRRRQPARRANPDETIPMNDDTGRCPATNRQGEQCGHPEGWGTDNDSGPCKFHGGATEGAGPPDDNDNAAKAGAWADDFYQDFLTKQEQRRVKEATEIMGSQAGAQEIGRHVASLALEQFRRTGDERFLRRFESVCDKFGIAPEDELAVDVEQSGSMDVNISYDVVENDG